MSDSGRPRSLPPFPSEYRATGLLLHLTSLPSPYGIGDLGPPALAWIDRLHDAGQGWWQVLPVGPTGYGNSPYQSLSSFAGNSLFISPACLISDGLLQADDCEYHFASNVVDYNSVIPFKERLVQKAWAKFSAGARKDLRPAYDAFCAEQEHWLPARVLAKRICGPLRLNGRRTAERRRRGRRSRQIVTTGRSAQELRPCQGRGIDWRSALLRFAGLE